MAAGGASTCALRASGEVLCWGRNNYRQLGDGTTEDRLVPVQVEGLADAAEITAGNHCCARRRSGDVWCWGNDDDGEAGGHWFSPGPVEGVADVAQVASSGLATCALERRGTILCWGEDNVLGNGSDIHTPQPSHVVSITDAVAISSNCAVRRSGLVMCWGLNQCGEVGNGTTSFYEDVPVQVLGLNDAISVVHPHGECAVHAGGTVSCWGTCGGANRDSETPTPLPRIGDALAMSLGAYHLCARRKTGGIACWRDGPYQPNLLGSPVHDVPVTKADQPAQVPGLSNAISLAVGVEHTCVARATGDVVCWGNNDYGQLGDGTTESRGEPTPVVGLP